MGPTNRSAELADDLALVAAGDRAAFRRLYQATAPNLFAICLGITRDRAAAEDVLQDVYLKIWHAAGSFDPTRASATSWLGTIARNRAIDWHRSRASRPAAVDSDPNLLSDEAEPVDQRMIREHSEDAAFALVDDLGADEEEQLRTIYYEGLTYVQLAARDGLPLGTVKSRIRRIIAKLRQKLNDE